GGGQRLFAEDVDAAGQRRERDLRVDVGRRGDVDEIELRLFREELLPGGIETRTGRGGAGCVEPRRAQVRERDDLDVRALLVGGKVPFSRDETEADDGALHRIRS